MTLSPWLVLFLSIPVLLLGEWCVARWQALRRFNIPAPVVGGLIICVTVLLLNVTGLVKISFGASVTERWWTWLVSAGPEWETTPKRAVSAPFMVGFFVCVGLCASWTLVRKGGVLLLIFWAIASVFAILQNALGVGLSYAMGQHPLLGVMCGSVTLTGGHSTAQAFADSFAKAGLAGASVIGVAAATAGLIAGALIGGPIATRLIEKHKLKSKDRDASILGDEDAGANSSAEDASFFSLVKSLLKDGAKFWIALVIVALCVKGGAWVGYLLANKVGMTFPVSMGGMLVGLIVRNLHDAAGLKVLDGDVVDRLGAVLLGIFLSVTMAGLNLFELAAVAGPMLVMLVAQVLLMAAFAIWVTFRTMGKDYDAAVMAAGHCGFALGSTSNAVATMLTVVQRHGPSRKAFFIVPPTGALLIDVTNAVFITTCLNWFS